MRPTPHAATILSSARTAEFAVFTGNWHQNLKVSPFWRRYFDSMDKNGEYVSPPALNKLVDPPYNISTSVCLYMMALRSHTNYIYTGYNGVIATLLPLWRLRVRWEHPGHQDRGVHFRGPRQLFLGARGQVRRYQHLPPVLTLVYVDIANSRNLDTSCMWRWYTQWLGGRLWRQDEALLLWYIPMAEDLW